MSLKDMLNKVSEGIKDVVCEPDPEPITTETEQPAVVLPKGSTQAPFNMNGPVTASAGHVDEELRAKCSLHIFSPDAESDYLKFKETLDALRSPEDTDEAKLYKQAFNVEKKKAEGALTKASLLVSISQHEQRLAEVRRAADGDLARETQSHVGSIQDQSQAIDSEIGDLNAKIREIQAKITELQGQKAQNEAAINSAKKKIEEKRATYNTTLASFSLELSEGKDKITKFIGG